MIDLTVAAIPMYFATMGAEYRYMQSRAVEAAEAGEPEPAGVYTRPDTLASLSMGVGSLLVPLASAKLVPKLRWGGKYGKAVAATAVAAAAVTTVADRLVRRADAADRTGDTDGPTAVAAPSKVAKLGRLARRVRKVTAPAALVAGGLVASATVATAFSPAAQWEAKGRTRDRGKGVAAWAGAIAGWDFIYYWNHRWMHTTRAMWAVHVVHHSSERYNLSTALRQPVADLLGVYLPYGLLARMGYSPYLISQARALNLIYQYWIHTEAIDRLGPIEEVCNTASHHRVHHGSNRRYIDRNHGSILIIWDRLFGTFEREDDDEPVVYGLTKNIGRYDPVTIVGHEYRDIWRDVAASDNWTDRLSFAFRGPGWAYERHRELAAA